MHIRLGGASVEHWDRSHTGFLLGEDSMDISRDFGVGING